MTHATLDCIAITTCVLIQLSLEALVPMASITIRNLDDDVKTRLRMRAVGNGRSMEEEARLILSDAVGAEAERDVASYHPVVLRTS